MANEKILVVDDDANICELRRNGHKSVEISRHYSIQHKDSSKTKRVTFAKRR